MALLALDLLILGASGYTLFERVSKSLMNPPPVIAQAAPAAAMPPASAEPVSSKMTEPKMEEGSDEPEAEKEAPAPKKNRPAKKIGFHYRDPLAKRVSILGDFNRWSPQLMKKDAG